LSAAVADFLFELVNFLVLAAVLGRILFAPVRRALDAEAARHAAAEEEAVRLRREAEALGEAARRARNDATKEREALRRDVLEQARRDADRLLAEARETVRAERRAFEAELARRRGGEAVALAGVVGRIASDSVRGLLRSVDGPPLDRGLARAAGRELANLPEKDRLPALVEAARPLDPETRSGLEAALGGAFDERVVAELGAGVRVTTAAGQVDASAAAIARRAASELRRLEDAGDG